MVSTFHADVMSRFGLLEHCIIALERRFDVPAVRAVGSVMGAAADVATGSAGSASGATGGARGGAMLGVTGGASGATSGAVDASVSLVALDVVSAEATVSILGVGERGRRGGELAERGRRVGLAECGRRVDARPEPREPRALVPRGRGARIGQVSGVTFAANVVKTHENTWRAKRAVNYVLSRVGQHALDDGAAKENAGEGL